MRVLTKDTVNKIGEEITLMGWVNSRRDHGKLIFIDLRDHWGVVQVVFAPRDGKHIENVESLRDEWVVKIRGLVKERPRDMENPEIATGRVEIQATGLEILAESKTPPFPINDGGKDIDEESRLKYRYLDLRRDRLQKNLQARSEFVRLARQFLFDKGFLEIETPILSAPTPEGSRDFVVPSRLNTGKFFALPQSPQQYKQLLMVAGFEKYFQIARCFRDEDLRADRGFEHTQIDLEMSFVNQADVMALDEEMMSTIVGAMGYQIKESPFPVYTYQEAMERFGSDKFDLRTEEEKRAGVLAYAWIKDFPFFERAGDGSWTFTHNPFSLAKPEHQEWLLGGKNVDKILTTQYDLVCNGVEVGGGSMRAHQPEMLSAAFRIMGYDDKAVVKNFGHMIEALQYGAPPHGGIAHGVERNLMTLMGEEFLREVQAFPQTSSGRTSVMNAPSEIEKKQLDELHIKTEE